MAGWLEGRIARHDFYFSKGFLAVSVLFSAIWMNVPTSCAQSQSDPTTDGFISIACGWNSDFNDTNGLYWVTDVNSTFINTGTVIFNETVNVSSRVFPDGRNKNCYELQPMSPNTTYLFRAGFYFDFQLVASLPISFDVSINATTVSTMIFDSDTIQPGEVVYQEIIFFSPGSVTYVCLRPVVGTSFISSLELRPFDPLMYSYSGSQTQYLALLARLNIGAPSSARLIRYPHDKYDRFWQSPSSTWQDLFPRVNASAPPDTTWRPEVNNVPPMVMQDAWGGVNMSMLWSPLFAMSGFPLIVNPGEYAYVAVYTEELVNDSIVGEMNIALDNSIGQNVNVSSQANMLAKESFILSANGIDFEITSPQNDYSAITMNAVEIYGQFSFNLSTTEPDEDKVVTFLKETFSLMDWQGDPCTPVPHDWLSCEVTPSQGSTAYICQKSDHNCQLATSFLRSTYSVAALNLSNLPASGLGLLQNYVALNPNINVLPSMTQMSIIESGVNGSIFQFLINDFCPGGDLNFLDFTSNNIDSLPAGEGWGQLDNLVSLNLSMNSITGNLRPFDNAPFVDSLQVLNLSYNSMTSIINNTWTNGTTALVALDLSYNNFEGDISSLDTLVQLSASTLQLLNVSNNNFTGTLSPLYFNLPNLTIAKFDGNSIQGTLNLTVWFAALEQNSSTSSSTSMTQKLFSFVGNSISNIVPSAAAMDSTITGLRAFNSHFSSNGILLGGNPFCKGAKSETEQYLCRSNVNDPIISPHNRNSERVMIIGICVGLGGLLLACATAGAMWKLWKKAKKKVHALEEIQRALADRKVQPPFFQYSDLKLATRDFHKFNLLGRGGFGEVHWGVLPDNTNLAVKTLFSSGQALDEFLNEVVLITGIKHRNLVQLKGCCINNHQRLDQRMLVYEFAENGNLAEALWGSKTHDCLNWKQRLNICVGVARGLSYLHEELQPAIIHRDIKPENILLDKNLQPKIADFGLAKVFSGDKSEAVYTKIAGTLGYFAPEYATQGQLSEKADVYSYGIVVLETISGRKCIDDSQPIERIYLKDWVLGLKKNGLLLDILQLELRDSCEASEGLQAINIGLQCLHHDPTCRPSMSEVVSMFLGHTRNNPLETSLEKSIDGQPTQDLLGITTQQLGLPSARLLMGTKSDDSIPLINFEASSSSGSRRLSRGPSSKTMIQLTPLVGR